jgi:hypothetical protein
MGAMVERAGHICRPTVRQKIATFINCLIHRGLVRLSHNSGPIPDVGDPSPATKQTYAVRQTAPLFRSPHRRSRAIEQSTPTSSRGLADGHRSAPAGSQVVRIPGLQARPLGDGTSIGTVRVLAFRPLRPAGRRVLPLLLPSVDGQVEQPVAVIHHLDAAPRRPVSLEDIGPSSQVANYCIMPTRRPTKRVSSESLAEYQGISQPMKSRYRALSSYGPWQNVA